MNDDLLLVTAAELARAASPDSTWSRLEDEPTDEMRHALDYAQHAVAGRLGFHPLVQAYADAQTYPTPYAAGSGGYPYGYTLPDTLYPQARPVVEVFTDGVTTDGRVFFPTPAAVPYPVPSVAYVAGWRGAHHVLPADGEAAGAGEVDLRTLPGLSGLTALPPLVPGDVRSVIVELALVELDKRRQNLLGGKRSTTSIGDDNYTSEGYRASAEEEALNRLSTRHRIARV